MVDHFDDLPPVGVHVRLDLPEHVDQRFVDLFVHGDVDGHLWIEAVVRHSDHTAPGSGTVYHTAVGSCGLVDQKVSCGIWEWEIEVFKLVLHIT